MSIAVLAYLAVINIITFGLYGLDKYRAMNKYVENSREDIVRGCRNWGSLWCIFRNAYFSS